MANITIAGIYGIVASSHNIRQGLVCAVTSVLSLCEDAIRPFFESKTHQRVQIEWFCKRLVFEEILLFPLGNPHIHATKPPGSWCARDLVYKQAVSRKFLQLS